MLSSAVTLTFGGIVRTSVLLDGSCKIWLPPCLQALMYVTSLSEFEYRKGQTFQLDSDRDTADLFQQLAGKPCSVRADNTKLPKQSLFIWCATSLDSELSKSQC